EVLFSFGLLTIFYLKYNLYTGKAGFIFKEEFTGFKGIATLFLILISNFAGVAVWSFIVGFTKYSQTIVSNAQIICEARTGMPSLNLFMSAVGCGIMMNVAARTKEKSILTVLCVVIFLTLGFSHCIADFFYYTVTGFKIAYIRTVLISVFGNLIGGNLLRFWFLDNSENLGKNNHEDN
ncbi:MAG: formate/nitrite transporter family protein, partial [Oscillospiraceae bacterium]|nr:formate/nitrite transporter family protein [Oscillospiraceae bacterium]